MRKNIEDFFLELHTYLKRNYVKKLETNVIPVNTKKFFVFEWYTLGTNKFNINKNHSISVPSINVNIISTHIWQKRNRRSKDTKLDSIVCDDVL